MKNENLKYATQDYIKNANRALYQLGSDAFDAWYMKHTYLDEMPDDKYEELLENLAWNAYYNDNYKIPSIEFGYFIIGEVYNFTMANEYYADYMEEDKSEDVA